MTGRTADQQLADEALAAAALVLAMARDDDEGAQALLVGADVGGIAAHLAVGTVYLFEILAEVDGESTETAERLILAWQQRLLEMNGWENGL